MLYSNDCSLTESAPLFKSGQDKSYFERLVQLDAANPKTLWFTEAAQELFVEGRRRRLDTGKMTLPRPLGPSGAVFGGEAMSARLL